MKKIAPIFLLLIVSALGCKFLGSAGGGGGGASNTAGDGGGGGDPKAAVIAASRKLIDLKAFSAKMDGMGTSEIKQQVDYVAPDRYHIIYTAGAAPGMEMIFIGSDMYMKTGGKWSKTPGNAAAIPTLRDSFTEEGLKSLADVKSEGEDTVDGKSAYVYSYKNVTPKGSFPFNAKIWVAKSTGIPIKIVADYPTNTALKQMTVNYDTETPVTINPPL